MNKTRIRKFRIILVGALLVFITGCSGPSEPTNRAINIKAGETISFTDYKAGGMENGWSAPESGGTWSADENTSLYFVYQEKFDTGLRLAISMISFANEKNPFVSLALSANETTISEINFDQENFQGTYTVDISPEILAKDPGKIKLDFKITNAARPKDLGYSQDKRKLGVYLMKITPSSI